MKQVVDEILQLLSYNIVNSIEDDKIELKEEMRRQREFISQAKSELRELVESKKKVNSWAGTKSDGDPLVSLGYNQAIDDVIKLFK